LEFRFKNAAGTKIDSFLEEFQVFSEPDMAALQSEIVEF